MGYWVPDHPEEYGSSTCATIHLSREQVIPHRPNIDAVRSHFYSSIARIDQPPRSFLNHPQPQSGEILHGVRTHPVDVRLLGNEPASPSPGMTLFAYAAELEIQYCRLRVSTGADASREARELTLDLIGILGLPQAAEPLPPSLLPSLFPDAAKLPTR
jgi:hypothetical protein